MVINASVAGISGSFWLSDSLRGMLFLLAIATLIWLVFRLAGESHNNGFPPVLGLLIVATLVMGGMHAWANKNDPVAQLSLAERQVIALENQGQLTDVVVDNQWHTQYFRAVDTDGVEVCGELVLLPPPSGQLIGGEDTFRVTSWPCS